MSMRRHHRRTLLRDTDALHALAIAFLALCGSAGILYLGYAWHVFRIARRAPVLPELDHVDAVLVFGKHCPSGDPDADFRSRIERARALALARPGLPIVLLGGGTSPTEAEVAARALRAGPLPADCELVLEQHSRDTLENLRHARDLLQQRRAADALLLSSRYHLARCSMLARELGIPHRVCAAEEEPPRGLCGWRPLLGEAAYVMWIDVGQRWARLTRNRRMQARLR
jgi:uncharacterized SAM-binding protein YcdF (DUF218 family)